MNHQDMFPPPPQVGVAPDVREFIDNRRRRAAYIGQFQLVNT